jgi:hypothetical protein
VEELPKLLPWRTAIALLRERTGWSVGYAEDELRKALPKIRHVYNYDSDPVLLVYDDGAVDMNLRPGAINKGGVSPDGRSLGPQPPQDPSHLNTADFLYWLDHEHPAKSKVFSTQDWIVNDIKIMKTDGVIPVDIRISKFARILAKRMDKAAQAGKVRRSVSWRYIKNELPGWGLWPVNKIK